MTEVTVYSIPPLISALFLFSLGVVTLASTGRERLWRVFATFCFVVGVSSFFGFLIEVSGGAEKIIHYARLELFFLLVSLSFANFYGIEMTGYKFGMASRHRMVMRTAVGIVVSIWAATLVMMYLTEWVISDVERLQPHGFQLTYGPVMWGLLGIYFAGTVRNLLFLLLAYKKATDRVFRQFVGMNVIAFHTIFAPAIWLLFVLPVFGYPTQVLAYLAFPVAVTVFYVAIVRFQFARVTDLNVYLEHKVEERTEELKLTQGRLAQSERMASLGQLVAGVAHEINNPVAAVRSMAASVTSAVKIFRTQAGGGPLDLDRMENAIAVLDDAGRVIDEGTKRITGVVDNLKSFARLDEAELQRADINKELGDTIEFLQAVLKPGVTVKGDFGRVPSVLCYPARLNQVFLNLFINANEAIDGEGVIAVTTGAGVGSARVTIRDTGAGIEEHNLDRVFEPGFTTKGAGVGTGLGLAICYQIVRDHEGDIRVSSEVGEGTAFEIVLPIDGPRPRR